MGCFFNWKSLSSVINLGDRVLEVAVAHTLRRTVAVEEGSRRKLLHRLTMRLYQLTMRLHRLTMRLYQLTMRLHRLTMRLHRLTMRLHRLTMRLYRLTMRLHRLTMGSIPNMQKP
ncbi:MAG: hypothetical protein V7K92_06455 [Nostoc sp.]|uniref:hypothetical protein n=1 Tax=Nostoc sp. TaxID=1180 RepID=UPI002FF2B608